MKKPYSNYLYFNKKELEVINQMDPAKVVFNIKHKTRCTTKDALVEINMINLAVYGQEAAKGRNCTHYFFKGAGFYNWLESAAPPLTNEHLEIIREMTYGDKVLMFHYEGGLSPCYLVFAVKAVDFDMSEHGYRIFISEGKNKPCVYVSPGYDSSGDYDIDRPTKIVSASMAYIMAFPEMINPGIPDDLRHPNHYRKAISKTVGMSPQIIERDGPTPHFRVGHFRHLISERFKHKRGQTVFVRGTFVKGKAETVLSPDANAQ